MSSWRFGRSFSFLTGWFVCSMLIFQGSMESQWISQVFRSLLNCTFARLRAKMSQSSALHSMPWRIKRLGVLVFGGEMGLMFSTRWAQIPFINRAKTKTMWKIASIPTVVFHWFLAAMVSKIYWTPTKILSIREQKAKIHVSAQKSLGWHRLFILVSKMVIFVQGWTVKILGV